jgi:hypothetical protein
MAFSRPSTYARSIKAETAILDGEIVALDKKGLPCFAGLRSGTAARECAIVFYAFDLLYLNGKDLRHARCNGLCLYLAPAVTASLSQCCKGRWK